MKHYLLIAFFLSLAQLAQAQTVRGTVTDSQGEALPGVNIRVQNTSRGATTDINGAFSLNASSSDTLVFSYIGYVSETVPVGNRSTIDVRLLEDLQTLSEVVVVGYGTSTKKELTGAVSIVNSDAIQELKPQRIEQALQGQVPGMVINSASGSPGGGLNIRIRGLSTNGENAPLVVVDGIVYDTDGLSALNPDDIESINVLKDGTAGIYGVRAANGVIIIETKRGRRNSKPTISLNGYYGVQETSRKLDLLNAREYAILKNETFASGGMVAPFTDVDALGEGTDWQDEVFVSAPIQNYNMTVTGGTEKSSYSVGGSFLDQEGIVGGDKSGYRRYNFRLNFSTDLAPKVTLNNTLLYTNENRSVLPENVISSVLYNTINAPATTPVRNADGTYSYIESINDVINPLAQIENSFNEAVTNKLVGTQEIVYDISDAFTVTGRAGYNYALVDYKQFNPLVYYGSGKPQNTALNADLDPITTEIATDVEIPIRNSVNESISTFFNYNLEAFLNYNQKFGELHGVKATLGGSMWGERGKNLSGTAYNVPYNSNEYADISATDGSDLLNNVSSYQFRQRLQSIFLRGEYNYADRYIFSALVRRDQSSNFGPNYQVGYFPTGSAAWLLSEEDFWTSDAIDFVKLRASFGVSGNDQIGLFRYRGLLNGEGVYPFNDQLITGVAIGTLGNPDLKWESTEQFNIGSDLTLLNDRLSLTLDYYVKTTRDLLFQPDVSGVLGAYGAAGNPPFVNAGTVRNQGFEFSATYGQEITPNINFSVGYNLTTIDNEVIDLPQGVEFIETGAFGVGGTTSSRMEVGYPLGYFFGYETDGVYQTAEEVSSRGVDQPLAQAGDLRFVDQNGDGEVNFSDDSDKTIIGSPIPDMTMGLNLTLNVHGFDIVANMYASIGNDILRNYERQQPYSNLLDYRLGRWTGPGSTNEHPRLTTELTNNYVISDYFVEDGSFLRVKNLQLGYTLPESITQNIGAEQLRVYVSATNPFTFTEYMGYDPDFNNGNPLASGIDYGFYPQATIYMAGFNLKF
ncbi:SusC/RagA family TonB-linked outer membrane protein [Roseivirga sp. BDSF3-8]|uniref:SusC/RagA family TonB-linked outer membrane protein n=1 Tax=Roseivirga sp. BDSF3-8 TaxID=3241598 RepID=UPI0035318E28